MQKDICTCTLATTLLEMYIYQKHSKLSDGEPAKFYKLRTLAFFNSLSTKKKLRNEKLV